MKVKKFRRLSMDLTKDRGGHVKILPVEQTFGDMPEPMTWQWYGGGYSVPVGQ